MSDGFEEEDDDKPSWLTGDGLPRRGLRINPPNVVNDRTGDEPSGWVSRIKDAMAGRVSEYSANNVAMGIPREPKSWLIIGPVNAGKTFLLLALGRAASLPEKNDLSLRFIPGKLTSYLMSRAIDIITGGELPEATSIINDYSFEISTNFKVEGSKESDRANLNVTVTDGPGGWLFTYEQSHDYREMGPLISKARQANSLILCVDAEYPHGILIEKCLPKLIAEFVEEQDISVEYPERRSFWDRMLRRPRPRHLERRRFLNADKFLILLNKVDILCDDYGIASRVNPLDLAHQLLGVNIINQIQQALKPSAKLAIGVTSSLGFDPTTGAPIANRRGFVFRTPSTTEDEILRRWTPLGVRDALVFLVTGQAFGSVKLVAPEHNQRQVEEEHMINALAQELQRIDGLSALAQAEEVVKSHLDQMRYFHVIRRVRAISVLAQEYLIRTTLNGRLNVLEELEEESISFHDAIANTPSPVGSSIRPIAKRWLEIVKAAEEECRKQLAFTPILNPFIVGNPLKPRDNDLFKGRRDIMRAIEEYIMNPSARPGLFLYGRKRIGKSSTLLNLPKLISSRYIPVYIDCMNAKWRDSDNMFCYHLVNSIYSELFQGHLLRGGLQQPREAEFALHAFTRLDEYLNGIEAVSENIGKQILLTFDEYEKMEEGVQAGSISREVFNQLRHLVQHRERLVVLFSGSHRFEEARTVNWSDYLINVKTLELSYLAPGEARELVERPVPDFKLRYSPGVVERFLQLTHCQPYLLQAVASDLVNYLNGQKRQTATLDDLQVAVEKVLVTAQAYFHYLWSEDCNDAERELLRALATDEAVGAQVEKHQTAWQSLCRKEIVEMRDDRYRFAVELFCLWVLKNQIAPSHYPPSRQSAGPIIG